MFEDLFKRFNTDLKRQADMVLSKPNRATGFDVIKFMRADTITQGVCVIRQAMCPLPWHLFCNFDFFDDQLFYMIYHIMIFFIVLYFLFILFYIYVFMNVFT